MSFDNVIAGSNFIFDERSSVRSRDHLSFNVIDARAHRADLLELDGLGTNTEKESFSTSKTHRVTDVPGAVNPHEPRVTVKGKSLKSKRQRALGKNEHSETCRPKNPGCALESRAAML